MYIRCDSQILMIDLNIGALSRKTEGVMETLDFSDLVKWL
jgi:hypothetical protein